MKTKVVFYCLLITYISFVHTAYAQTGLTKLGASALAANTTGDYNTAIGYYALKANISGSYNQAFGYKALLTNTTGSGNTATGYQSLYTNSSGNYNTANGYQSLHNLSSNYENTASGYQAMYSTTVGGYNSAYGSRALYSNTSGAFNVANGFKSLYYNTTGNNNVATGTYSLYYNKEGYSNTANGYSSLYDNLDGYQNTATGYYSLYFNINGYGNTANGYNALFLNSSGFFNTGLGYNANVAVSNLSNATAIGYNATVDASNKVRIGNTAVTSIGGQVGWTTFSDGRYKKEVKENVPGLTFINSLRPVTYTVNVNGLNEYYKKENKPSPNNEANASIDAETEKSIAAAGKVIYNGFIAQEVEEAATKLNFAFSGVDKPKSKDGLYGLRYDNFVIPLVKAVQELSAENNELKARLEKLEAIVSVNNNVQKTTITATNAAIELSGATLEQNTPNPFTGNTVIRYKVPASVTSAQIMVTNTAGNTVKAFTLSNKGAGSVTINANELSAGSYFYTLIVDGKKADSKQMILVK